MKKIDLSDDLLDLYVRGRASAVSSLVEDPGKELGPDDEWIHDRIKAYMYTLSSDNFLDFIEKVIRLTTQKYCALPDVNDIVFLVVQDTLFHRETKKYLVRFPAKEVVPLDLNEEQEQRLINILLLLKEKLPPAHRYKVNSLIQDLTGVNIRKPGKY